MNEAGITVDAESTAAAAMEGSTSLPAFVRSLFAGRTVDPVMTVDDDSIRKLVYPSANLSQSAKKIPVAHGAQTIIISL